jgi:hypothetical protein
MLAKDPAQRFQTPIEVAQALVAFTKPGSKPSMAAVPPPLPDVGAPGTRTAISGDTSQFKEPKPTPISQPPALKPVEKAAPLYPEWMDVVPDAPRKATKASETPAPARAPWYRRGFVLAGLGVALLALGGGFLAAMIFKDNKEKTADPIKEPLEQRPIVVQSREEQKKPASGELPKVVSIWSHRAGNLEPVPIRLYSNGRLNAPDSPYTWERRGNQLIFRWPNPVAPGAVWEDDLTIADDGESYRGKNQEGAAISGVRIHEGDAPREPTHVASNSNPVKQPETKDPPPEPMPTVKPPDPPPPDPSPAIQKRIDRAKAEFQTEMGKLRQALLENLDKAEKRAMQVGDKERMDKIKEERAAFEKNGKLPTTVAIRSYLKLRIDPRKALIDAYKGAARDYHKAKLEDQAETVQNERKRFELDEPADCFLAGTVWKGTKRWEVLGTPEKGSLPITLTVLERSGTTFQVKIDGTGLHQEIKGTIKDSKVSWQAADVKVEIGDQGVDHSGQITRDVDLGLSSKWTRAKDSRTVLATTHLQLAWD